MVRYVEVAVALPVRETFHYAVPARFDAHARVGTRVLAPFGRRGVNGVVVSETSALPEGVTAKELDDVVGGPAVPRDLLELCQWVASYYEAPIGEVLQAALPVASKNASFEVLALTEKGKEMAQGGALPKGLREVVAGIHSQGGSVKKAALAKLGLRPKDVEQALTLGWVEFERTYARARVDHRRVRVAMLLSAVAEPEVTFARAPKQAEVVRALIACGGSAPVPVLARSIPHVATHLRKLEKDGWVRIEEQTLEPGLGAKLLTMAVVPPLHDEQARALEAISAGLDANTFSAYLLHGITGSGKTEVYLRAIAQVVESGKTALILVPEISLTPQLASRFRARFGEEVAVLHSGLRDRERFDEWHRVANGRAKIALGARSAVFAPIENLGIIVVDEEHDSSFKQEEGVRYHARHVALQRANKAGCVCVLGSATPSLESFQLAREGRVQKLVLEKRATAGVLPDVELIDLRKYQPDKDTFLTAPLRQAVVEALAKQEQIILFLNRRGFHTFVLCVTCGYAFRCPSCSVSLTFHKGAEQLLCHYCGHSERPAKTCPECHGESIAKKGLGTERVAEAITEAFPEARVLKLDRDTKSMTSVLDTFGKKQADILVGTQMVTKGHDFPGVTLVGVLCADTGLSMPDFRAGERTFQLLCQVAGRAGRGDKKGKVFIQTYRADVPAIRHAKKHDYHGFAEAELAVRQELGYPPFGHLAAIRFDGEDALEVESAARGLARRAQSQLVTGMSLLGPSEAPLSRLKGRTRWHIWVRCHERAKLRAFLRELQKEPWTQDRRIRVTLDIDPVSAL